MTESEDPAARIATALARLRAGRPMPPLRGMRPYPGPPSGEVGREREGGADFPHGRHPGHHHPVPGGPDHHRGEFGRSLARLRLLELLAAADGPLAIGTIAERLGVDQPRASRLVQGSVEQGHARREADPDDARRTLIALSDDGRAIADRFRGARTDLVVRALDGFSAAEKAQLADLLARLAAAWPNG